MGVAGFTFSGGAEHGGNVVIAFNVGLACEVQVAPIGHGFAGKGVLQILFGLGAFQHAHDITSCAGLDEGNAGDGLTVVTLVSLIPPGQQPYR
ncbi:hypothetical protein D3C78_1696010 [compost metagenome]